MGNVSTCNATSSKNGRPAFLDTTSHQTQHVSTASCSILGNDPSGCRSSHVIAVLYCANIALVAKTLFMSSTDVSKDIEVQEKAPYLDFEYSFVQKPVHTEAQETLKPLQPWNLHLDTLVCSLKIHVFLHCDLQDSACHLG